MDSKTPITSWERKELIFPTTAPTVQRGAIALDVPLNLAERRIYVYLEVLQSAAGAFTLGCDILCKNRGNVVAKMPANLKDFTNLSPNESSVSLFSAGGSPVGDSCVLKLAQPFVGTVLSVVVQPLRINGEFDQLVLDVSDVSGATLAGWRAFLGCLSTKF